MSKSDAHTLKVKINCEIVDQNNELKDSKTLSIVKKKVINAALKTQAMQLIIRLTN